MVSADYFRTLGIPLLAGRSFGPQDGPTSTPVAVISESVARQLWSGTNPIGQSFDWNAGRCEVIGVVGDIRGADGRGGRGGGPDRAPSAAVYLSAAQRPQGAMTLVIRTSGELAVTVPRIARAVRDIDPAQPVYQIRRLHDWLAESTAQPRFTTMLCAVLAVVALLLAAVGAYGVLSYSVAQRTQEIGVRMAIGAARGQIMRLVLKGGMSWALIGIAIGLLGAFVFSQVLARLLFEVRARDPISYAAVAVILALVAMAACCIPAARATRIDPIIALRSE
jgi:putative ABC transport system permease protein